MAPKLAGEVRAAAEGYAAKTPGLYQEMRRLGYGDPNAQPGRPGYVTDLTLRNVLRRVTPVEEGVETAGRKALGKATRTERFAHRTGRAARAIDYISPSRPDLAARIGLGDEMGDVAHWGFAEKVRDQYANVMDLGDMANQLIQQNPTMRPAAAYKTAVQSMKAWRLAHPDWTIITRSKRLPGTPFEMGPLAGYGLRGWSDQAGMWARNERVAIPTDLYEIIKGLYLPRAENKWARLAEQLSSSVKAGFTIFRPGAHGRQGISNYFFGGDALGLDPFAPTTVAKYADAIPDIINNAGPVKQFRDLGVIGSDARVTRLARDILDPFEEIARSGKRDRGVIDAVTDALQRFNRSEKAQTASDVWQFSDDIVKYTAAKDAMRRGMTAREAADWVAEHAPMSTRTPDVIAGMEKSRLAPFMPLFGRYQYHALRVMKNLALTPAGQLKIAKWGLWAWLAGEGLHEATGGKLSLEQLGELRDDPRRMLAPVPAVDAKGRPLSADLTYIHPFGDWAKMFLQLKEGSLEGAAAFMQNPFFSVVEDLLRDQDSYTGKRLFGPAAEEMTLGGRAGIAVGHAASKLAPPVLYRDIPALAPGLLEAAGHPGAAKEVSGRLGQREVEPLEGALVSRIGGFRTVPGDTKQAMISTRAAYLARKGEIDRDLGALRRQVRDGKLSKERYREALLALKKRLAADAKEAGSRLRSLRGAPEK